MVQTKLSGFNVEFIWGKAFLKEPKCHYGILEISTLPVGDYTFYFGVDMIMNGTLDLNNLFYDSVKVNIE